jgi:MoxR-like ATPase
MTTNGEREFSPAFRRRCLELEIKFPSPESLAKIIKRQIKIEEEIEIEETEKGTYTSPNKKLDDLLKELQSGDKAISDTAIDQVLNAFYFMRQEFKSDEDTLKAICHPLTQPVS